MPLSHRVPGRRKRSSLFCVSFWLWKPMRSAPSCLQNANQRRHQAQRKMRRFKWLHLILNCRSKIWPAASAQERRWNRTRFHTSWNTDKINTNTWIWCASHNFPFITVYALSLAQGFSMTFESTSRQVSLSRTLARQSSSCLTTPRRHANVELNSC